MNIILRFLIVTCNFILAPIMNLIMTIGLLFMCLYVKIRYGEWYFKEVMEIYCEGIEEGLEANLEFMKTGDLNIFKQ